MTKAMPAAATRAKPVPRPADRRAQILTAAAELFADYGYEATSVRQIADAVNILAGSLYHHFATKEEMLHHILRERIDVMVADHERVLNLPVDAEHRLIVSVILRFRQYVDQWQFHALLMQENRFFRRNADFAYVVDAKMHGYASQQQMLREGIEAGLFRPEIDTYLMIGTIARMLSSAASWYRSGELYNSDRPTGYALDTVIDYNIDVVLRMLRKPARLEDAIPRQTCEGLLRGTVTSI